MSQAANIEFVTTFHSALHSATPPTSSNRDYYCPIRVLNSFLLLNWFHQADHSVFKTHAYATSTLRRHFSVTELILTVFDV